MENSKPNLQPLHFKLEEAYNNNYNEPLITIVETNTYIADAKSILSDEERVEVINKLASNPMCGILIRGGGGIRKVRFATGNKGKSGSVRIIYFYHNHKMPIYLITVFAKNEKENLTSAEVNNIAKVVIQICGKLGERK